jgi:hypothetical protein
MGNPDEIIECYRCGMWVNKTNAIAVIVNGKRLYADTIICALLIVLEHGTSGTIYGNCAATGENISIEISDGKYSPSTSPKNIPVVLYNLSHERTKLFKNLATASEFASHNQWASDDPIYTIDETIDLIKQFTTIACHRCGMRGSPAYGAILYVETENFYLYTHRNASHSRCKEYNLSKAMYESCIICALKDAVDFGSGIIHTHCAATGANITIELIGTKINSMVPSSAVVLVGGLELTSDRVRDIIGGGMCIYNKMFINRKTAVNFFANHSALWLHAQINLEQVLSLQELLSAIYTDCQFCGKWANPLYHPVVIAGAHKLFTDSPLCALKYIFWHANGSGIINAKCIESWMNISITIKDGTITSIVPVNAVIYIISGYNYIFADEECIDEWIASSSLPWVRGRTGTVYTLDQAVNEFIKKGTPELLVSKVELNKDTIDLAQGEIITISAQITNLGTSSAHYICILFMDGGSFIGDEYVFSLPAGEGVEVCHEWTPAPGEHKLKVIIADNNATNDYGMTVSVSYRTNGPPGEKNFQPAFDTFCVLLAISVLTALKNRRQIRIFFI